ncbi:MAG TPA: hypothetical protein VGR57_15140 [Ktedonobacterales bacterium]|nr:hypothetical protein [Ktedonobacterales bacterium]
MPRVSIALHPVGPLLLGLVIGLSPALWVALSFRNSVPDLDIPFLAAGLHTPFLVAAYTSYLALAFIATTCLMRPAQRRLGVGMALGLLVITIIATALYVVLLFQLEGSYN